MGIQAKHKHDATLSRAPNLQLEKFTKTTTDMENSSLIPVLHWSNQKLHDILFVNLKKCARRNDKN